MKILAIDTSTPQVTAGVVERHGAQLETLAQRAHLDARAHNEILVPLIQDCLVEAGITGADLDAVVVGCGPGPFTGLRVGMATAASFADALGIACEGICSLDALASAEGYSLVVTDARRREVYYAAYLDGRRIFGPAVGPADAVLATVAAEIADFEPVTVRGSARHAALIDASRAQEVLPTAAAMVSVAQRLPVVPLYLRRPDAAVPKAMRAPRD